MPRRQRSRGDSGKAPAYTSSRGYSSNSDKEVSAREQVARSPKRHYDKGGENITSIEGIGIAHHTKSQCSVETTNASSQCHSTSSGAS